MKKLSKLLALFVTVNTLCVFAKADLTGALRIQECVMGKVDWSSRDLNSYDAIFIMEALRNDETITTLDLSNNSIEYISELKTSRDAKAAKNHPNKTLKVLILANNPLDSDYLGRIVYIMCAFEALEEINLQGTGISEHRMREIIGSEVAEKLKLKQVWRVEGEKFLKIKPGEAGIPEIEREESEGVSLSYTDEGSEEESWSGGKKKKRGGKKSLSKKQYFQSSDDEDIDEEDREEA